MTSTEVKVIHIVENLNRGAVENWLVRMLRHARSRGVKLDWTFYCTLGEPGKLDDEARQLGARIIHSPVPLLQKTPFIRHLRDTLRAGGYDVLHAHHDLVSGIYLAASLGLPILRRIVHVHNADEAIPTSSQFKKNLARPILRRVCLTMADQIIGISNHTLGSFLAGRARRPGRDRVHYYGIDPTPFLQADGDRARFRRELDLPEEARILLFAGRMVPEKNPLFAVEVFAEMHQRNPRVHGVFVGTGSLDEAAARRAAELGVNHAFRALGWRDDIPEIMCCCDWFILPRPEKPMEGLGIAVVEGQLAGLRLLLSRGISDDPILPEAVCTRLPLSESAGHWAEAGLKLMSRNPSGRTRAAKILSGSPFDLNHALDDLLSLHGHS